MEIILLAMKDQSHPFSFMMEKILKAIELDLNFHTDCSRLKRKVINLRISPRELNYLGAGLALNCISFSSILSKEQAMSVAREVCSHFQRPDSHGQYLGPITSSCPSSCCR